MNSLRNQVRQRLADGERECEALPFPDTTP